MAIDRSKRAYHHGDLRNALIRAGQELLSEEGVAGLELRKVARRAGVSHAAPYRHFVDRQALLAAIAEEGFGQLSACISAALADIPDNVIIRLEQAGLAYVQFAHNNPALIREMFSGLSVNRKAHPSLYASSKAAFWQLVEIMERGQQQGLVVAGDASEQTFVIWSMIHGLAMLAIENQIPPEYSVAIESTVKLFVQTLYTGLEHRAAHEGEVQ